MTMTLRDIIIVSEEHWPHPPSQRDLSASGEWGFAGVRRKDII